MPYYMSQKMSSGELPTLRYFRKAAGQPNPSKAEREAFTTEAAAKYAKMNGIDLAAVKREKLAVMYKPDSGEEI
ncbi:MAG: hypothetical protein ACLP0J_24765 [Solirubrobacteraceae bacterium]